MRAVFTLLLTFTTLFSIQAQQADFWYDASKSAAWDFQPSEYRSMELDQEGMQAYLKKAPLELTDGEPIEISLPLPDGSMETFTVVESPVMRPGLAAKFPEIKTYSGQGVDHPAYRTRFGFTARGFHAVIRTSSGRVYIDPSGPDQTANYMVYYTRDFNPEDQGLALPEAACGWTPDANGTDLPKEEETVNPLAKTVEADEVELRVYELALACTGEFAVANGSSEAGVMAAFTTAINRVNEIVQLEVAFKFELVDNNDALIFLNPANDPYVNATFGAGLLDQNQGVLNSVIGIENYDIGHIFTIGCTDVGGIAGGAACSNGAGRGVTCHFTSNVTYIAEEIMAHELAHQFSASHTWANCPGILGQLATQTAFEPGSGSTIMSYSGSCGNQNVSFNSDEYYHVGSLVQMTFFSRESSGNTCPTVLPTDNHFPTVELGYENGFYIPISTPFELDAVGADEDDDPITYCWEQYDLGPLSDIGLPEGDAPIFRSFPPTEESNRIFPQMNKIVLGTSDNTEVLPTYDRNLTFRCTVRDNDPNAGGAVWEEVKFKATETAGPFVVMYPNSGGIEWKTGDLVEVTWDVANTTNSLVNCQTVNIRLSTDGGYTYPHTLVSAAPNTGSAFLFAPDIQTSSARIRVEAADNVFFDISNNNFSIVPAEEPGYTVGFDSPVTQLVCLPIIASTDISTAAVLDYDATIEFDVVDGLPMGIPYSFTENSIQAGESTTLEFDFTALSEADTFNVVIQAISSLNDTFELTTVLNLVYADFSDLAMDTPVNGASSLSVTTNEYFWTELPFADSYDFQLASSPDFENDLLVEAYDLTEASFVSPVALDDTELYFWRVRAKNVCKLTDWLSPNAFHTVANDCEKYESIDIPLGISSIGTPTVKSELSIAEGGTILDLNVIDLVGYHESLGQLALKLRSPAGTTVNLFTNICGNTTPFNLELDDDSPLPIDCPPNDGQPYQPEGNLSDFIGESTAGIWELRATVTNDFGNGGIIETWGLEFCASFDPKNPVLVNNNELTVAPGGLRLVETDWLLAEDEDNTPEELQYTIVSPPQHGTLFWDDQAITAGGFFRQSSIDANNVWYEHDGGPETTDSFTFVVEDGTGGWIEITQFDISIEVGGPTGINDIAVAQKMRLFPNPSTGLVNLSLQNELQEDAQLRVVNVQGQVVHSQMLGTGTQSANLNLETLPHGMYFVQVQTADKLISGKIILE